MRISDLLAMCVRNLTRRKFRTFLTVMGVVIGTCAIVVMISLGEGINASSETFLSEAGDLSVIQVYGPYGNSQEVVLDDAMLHNFSQLEGVGAVTPLSRFQNVNGQLYAGKRDRYAYYIYNFIGVKPGALEQMGYAAATGEMLGTASGGRKIRILMGSQAVYDFEDVKKSYPNNRVWAEPDENGKLPDPFFDPLTEPLTLVFPPQEENGRELRYDVEVVGILEDSGNYDESTYGCYMDVADMQRVEADYKKANNIKDTANQPQGYDTVKVKVDDIKLVGAVETAIGTEEGYGFYTYSLGSIRESYEKNARQIQMILGALGFIALFVAAISITNTMIMSVYERTREIGVMKVLGCPVGNIRTIFLVEAAFIGFGGGAIGIGLSYLISLLLNIFGNNLGSILGDISYMMTETSKVSIIPPWLVLLGMTFATVIGLISGFYPANRAVKISALEAIRTE